MRIYDPRLGRFLSVDPITRQYPELTPYQFASNRPIEGIDQDGLEFTRYDLDSQDPNVQHMAEWSGDKYNYRDSKYYKIFNDARRGFSGSGGMTEGMAWALGGEIFGYGGKYIGGMYKYYRAATYLTRAESVIVKTGKAVWNMVPVKRGFAIEEAFGGNLPKGFLTIDKFVNGVAESIKSIGLDTKTYKDLGKLEGKLKEYVDVLSEFKGAVKEGVKVEEKDIKERVLTIGIEAGKGSTEQSKVFARVEEYAKDKGVKMVTKAVE
jgi:hypothetical protein